MLVSWIGHNDMRAFALSLPAKQRDEILTALPGPRPAENEVGPIKTLVEQEQFDEIRLLSNFSRAWEKGYDLSINRYKEIVHEEVQYDPPKTILKRLKKMESEIAKDLEELEAMLQ
jgi:hypothetical protein